MSPENPETPNPLPGPEPAAAAPNRRRNIFSGALLGAVALTASVVAVGAVAGAQDEPAVDEDESAETFEAAEMDDIDEGAEIIELDEGDLDEMELDDDMMIEGLEFDDEAWAAFDECLTSQLGDLDEIDEDGVVAELSDEEWEALEKQFVDAEKACEDLLPEAAKAEIAAFEAYDQCLSDAGLPGEDAVGTIVFIEGDEGGEAIQFGDTPGSVTITGDSSGVTVATEGGVTSFDDEAFEAAFEACDDLLPEDVMHIEEVDIDEGEFADEVELDEGDLDEGTDEDGDDA